MIAQYKAVFDYEEEQKDPVSACNLCGRDDRVVTTTQGDRYGFLVGVGHCTNCNLLFLNPRLSPSAYTRFYQGPYRRYVSLYHGRDINAVTVEDDQRTYARLLGDILAQHLFCNSYGRLIDIGGSTGVVAEAIGKRFYYQGTVVDVAEEELARAKAKGLQTIHASAEDFIRTDLYDLALICQTIDHLLDPFRMLVKARNLLTDRGLLFVDILDFDQTLKFKVDHPYYFTKDTMLAMLWKAGFAVMQPIQMPECHVGFLAVPVKR